MRRTAFLAGIHWANYTFLPWLSDSFNLVPMELDTDQISAAIMEYVQTNYSADSIQAMIAKVGTIWTELHSDWWYGCADSNYCILFLIRLGSHVGQFASSYSTAI